MRILALDIASATGVAFGCADDSAPSLSTLRLPGASELNEYGPRLTAFRRGLIGLIADYRPERIWFEAPFIALNGGKIKNANSSRLLMILAGLAEQIADEFEIPTIETTNAEVRKHFLGSAHGLRDELKLAMLRRCRLLGWEPNNDNEADAAGIWDLARHKHRASRRLSSSMPLVGVSR